jgi:hypothetical protein
MPWIWCTITYVSGTSTSTVRFLFRAQLVTDRIASHTRREYLSSPSPREPQISLQSRQVLSESSMKIYPLNAICHLVALLGVHPILHVNRVRVKWRYRLPLTLPEPSKLTLWKSHQQRNKAMYYQFQIHTHARVYIHIRTRARACVYIYIHTHARTSLGVVYAVVSC